jgi:hypothetical protein
MSVYRDENQCPVLETSAIKPKSFYAAGKLFSDKYLDGKELNKDYYPPSLDNQFLAYSAAKKFADENGIKIYNATRGGKLEVFERVDFDSLFPAEIR